MIDHVKPCYVRLGQFRSGYIALGKDRTYVRLGYVRAG
jgi:hypothetical protein